MQARLVITVVAGSLALAACSQPPPVRDKADYLAHPTDRAAQLAECRANPGALASTPNCVNAAAAAADVERDHFWAIKKPKSRVINPGAL